MARFSMEKTYILLLSAQARLRYYYMAQEMDITFFTFVKIFGIF
jgi:hypothetical protein